MSIVDDFLKDLASDVARDAGSIGKLDGISRFTDNQTHINNEAMAGDFRCKKTLWFKSGQTTEEQQLSYQTCTCSRLSMPLIQASLGRLLDPSTKVHMIAVKDSSRRTEVTSCNSACITLKWRFSAMAGFRGTSGRAASHESGTGTGTGGRSCCCFAQSGSPLL